VEPIERVIRCLERFGGGWPVDPDGTLGSRVRADVVSFSTRGISAGAGTGGGAGTCSADDAVTASAPAVAGCSGGAPANGRHA
jgi:hypothetical protein